MGKRSREDDLVSTANSEGDSPPAASPAKIQEVEAKELNSNMEQMQCSLPPHLPLTFTSTADFDVHYAQQHTNRCSSCGKNFPSAHYLAIHIDENHNPVREALAAQGERTYACFVEDCDRKCSTPQKRRLHLIDKHMFPKSYNFRIVDQGIDRTGSLLLTGQRRRLSTSTQKGQQYRSLGTRKSSLPINGSSSGSNPTAPSSQVDSAQISEESTPRIDAKVDDLEKSFAALQFIPPSVQARQRNKNGGK